MQLQVLEPDYLDTSKHGITLPNGGRIIHGVEFDPIGRRVAYWLFPNIPAIRSGRRRLVGADSRRGVLHIFRPIGLAPCAARRGSRRSCLKFKDFDEYEDATLMKQKIAACLAVITSDVDGSGAPLGTADDTQRRQIDSLEPGRDSQRAGRPTVEVVQPPSVADYETTPA
jgi:capsid protein